MNQERTKQYLNQIDRMDRVRISNLQKHKVQFASAEKNFAFLLS